MYPGATWRPGPDWKTWGQTNSGAGVLLHSMEGYEAGAWSVLDGNAPASWHFSVMTDGAVYQHYDLKASCWHAGGRASNQQLIGIEHEGMKGQPLTDAQLASSVGLVRWLSQELGWEMRRGETMLEHREAPGAATTCPNGRIPWEAYVPENDPNREDNFDTGLTRLRLEDMLRLLRDEHRHAEGDPQVLHDIIDGRR